MLIRFQFTQVTHVSGRQYLIGDSADKLSAGRITALIAGERVVDTQLTPFREEEHPDDDGLTNDGEDTNQDDTDVDSDADDNDDSHESEESVVEESSEAQESDADGDDDQDSNPDDEVAIGNLGLAGGIVKLLKAANIHTLGDAREYYSTHGSFAPIKGIKSQSDEIAQTLGLTSPSA